MAAIIVPLKQIAKAHHLSAQRIYSMIEDSGDHVSLNTIKKFLADGSENESFNYYQSILPISLVLHGLEPDEAEAGQVDILKQYIRFLEEQIRIKDAQLNAALGITG